MPFLPHLLRISYASLSRLGDADAFVALARDAARTNARLRLTGVLLHDGEMFFQVLEGPAPVVRDRFEKIRRDPRHERIQALFEARTAIRQFPRWTSRAVRGPNLTLRPELIAPLPEEARISLARRLAAA
jgi:hypothetical protein